MTDSPNSLPEPQAMPQAVVNLRTQRSAVFGRSVPALGAIAATLGVLFAVWTWWSAGPRVVVKTIWSPLIYPSELQDVLAQLGDATINGLGPNETSSNQSAPSISPASIEYYFPWERITSLQDLNYFWRIQVTNRGHAQGEVSLRIPGVRYVTISRVGTPDESYIVAAGAERIDVGSVHSDEVVSIVAWGRSYSTAVPRDDQSIELYLNKGRGYISQKGLVGPRIHWLATEFISTVKFASWFTVVVLLLIIGISLLQSLWSNHARVETETDTSAEP